MREQIHDAHQTCNYVDLFKSVPQMDVISEMLNLITIIFHETIKTILYDNYRPIGAAVTIAPQFRTRNDNSATGVTSQKNTTTKKIHTPKLRDGDVRKQDATSRKLENKLDDTKYL
jgi:hypothetical protein